MKKQTIGRGSWGLHTVLLHTDVPPITLLVEDFSSCLHFVFPGYCVFTAGGRLSTVLEER